VATKSRSAGFNRTILDENFNSWPTGPLPADYTPRGEYYCLPTAPRADGWHDPINHTGRKGPRDQSVWHVKKLAGRKRLVQTSDSEHDPKLVATGRKPWQMGLLQATLTPKTDKHCGIILGYRHARDFFAVAITGRRQKRLQVIRYWQNERQILGDFAVDANGREIRIAASFQPGSIEPLLNGRSLGKVEAPGLNAGGVGLLANGPCRFDRVTLKSSEAHLRKIEAEQKRSAAALGRLQKQFPAAEKVLSIKIAPYSAGRQIRFVDLNGDGREEIILGMPSFVKGEIWTYRVLACLTAYDLDGNILWQVGEPPEKPEIITGDLPFQAADIDGDGRVEVVACFTSKLCIIDGATGKIKKTGYMPKPPKMEPFWDEISMYWGDGHGDDLPRAIPDSIRLCNLTGRGPYGDFIAKDRYHNVWAFTGDLKLMWLHQCNTGHFPFTSDINDDGYDEIMAGYSRLDRHGNLIGRIVVGDHPDACFWMKTASGRVREFHPAGEAGLIIHEPGGTFAERHLGHVQHLSVADFDRDHPGLELICITYWGEPGIVYMLDFDGRIMRDFEAVGLGAVCQPVNWTGDGTELILLTPDLKQGGLYDAHFNRVVPLPEADRPSYCCEARDVLGLGVDQIIVWDLDNLEVYAPATLPPKGRRRYRPIRPLVNQSNYMVYYSLPR